MQVQLLVERDQNECVVNLAGTAYKFKRNEHGHLVSEITDQEHIKWVSDPHNSAFKLYNPPKEKDPEPKPWQMGSAQFGNEVGKNAYAPHTGQVDESPVTEKKEPVYPAKGSHRPVKGKGKR